MRKANQGARPTPQSRRRGTPPKRGAQGKEGKKEGEDEKEKKDSKILLGTARVAMMVRSASLTYSQTNGTLLPGIITNPVSFGMDPSSLFAPGVDFVFGAQSAVAERAAENNWLTKNPKQPNQFQKTFSENLNFRAVVEPWQDIRLQITATRVAGLNSSSIYRFHDPLQDTTLGLSAHELDEDALRASDMLYIEGYLASSEKAREAAIRAHQIAKETGIKIALTFSDPAMVTYFKDQVTDMVGDGVDLLFCNEQEAMTWTGQASIEDALSALSNTARQWVCTRGKDGASVFDGQTRIDVPGRTVTPVDTNGAGDMFAGAFLFGQANGWDFERSARFGVHASGYLITQYGPRLGLASHAVLLEEFEATQ